MMIQRTVQMWLRKVRVGRVLEDTPSRLGGRGDVERVE